MRPVAQATGTAVIVVLALLAADRAGAATWLVDSTADAPDAVPGDAACADALGRCTLRAAVQTAGTGDEIVLPSGQFLLASTLELRSMSVTVTGAGADQTEIFTAPSFPASGGVLVSVVLGSPVVLRSLAIRHAAFPEGYPAVQASGGTLTMQDCRVADSTGPGVHVGGDSLLLERCEIVRTAGPGLRTSSTDVIVRDSVVSDNSVGIVASGVTRPCSVVIERSDISQNGGLDDGGGIRLRGVSATIDDCTIIGNGSGPGTGGVWSMSTEVTLRRCLIQGNTGQTAAAGIHVEYGLARIVDCTLADNVTIPDAGGAVSAVNSTVDLVNSTLTGNRADSAEGGSAVRARSSAGITLHSCTIVGRAGSGVLLAADDSSHIAIGGTVVAGADGLSGTVESLGFNIVEDPGAGVLTGDLSTLRTGVDPLLLPLADNGGGLPTHLPRATSPVLDAGDPAGCLDDLGNPLATDERGAARMEDGDADGVSRCDIGAVELGPSDPRVAAMPLPLIRVRRLGSAAALLIADDPAEPVLEHDIARATLSELRTARIADAACVAWNVGEPEWTDPEPAGPSGLYWLVRAITGSGRGRWGTDSLGRPRAPCP